jgi:hypothetical protein
MENKPLPENIISGSTEEVDSINAPFVELSRSPDILSNMAHLPVI